MGGLTITLTSLAPEVFTVAASAFVPEGQTTVSFAVEGVLAGNSTLLAEAPGTTGASASVVVGPTPNINRATANVTVGKDLQTSTWVRLSQTPPEPVDITVMIAVGIIVTSAPQSEAAIVYSGEVNINVPDDFDGLYLNVLDGSFGITDVDVPGWHINPYSAGAGEFNLWGQSAEAFLDIGGTLIHQADVMVDSGGTFTRPGGGANLAPQVTLGSSNNFIGFQFLNEDTSEIHFGWLRLAFGADVGTRVILDYAYEDTPGAGIKSGAVPEPGAIWLLALGAAGLMARRRRVT